MILDKKIAGSADFTFEYFTNGGYIGCSCPDCKEDIKLFIKIYKSGLLIESLTEEFGTQIIGELIKKNVINLKDNNNKWTSALSKYILWNMDARYEILSCNNCKNNFIAVFGMAELQPGREEVQFKGIWKINAPPTS